MQGYEYIRVKFDWGDFDLINRMGSAGWRVVKVNDTYGGYALLERPMSDELRVSVFEYYSKRDERKRE